MPSASRKCRRQCKTLITIGACATAGGIQALRNWKDVDEFIRVVYATPQFISTLKLSTPIAEHVPVDFRTARLPDQQIPTHRTDHRDAGRAQAEHSLLQRVHRVQAQGECVYLGGARGPLPWSGDSGGMRSAVPTLRPWLLRLLWTHGDSRIRHRSRASSGFWDSRTTQMARAFRGFNAWAWQFRKASEECERT